LNRAGGDPEIREKIESVGKSFGFTVMNEETNLGLGKALGTYFSLLLARLSFSLWRFPFDLSSAWWFAANLMRAVKSRFVLFLEKDWKLVEPRQTVIEQVTDPPPPSCCSPARSLTSSSS
jgi:hypothetical protein